MRTTLSLLLIFGLMTLTACVSSDLGKIVTGLSIVVTVERPTPGVSSTSTPETSPTDVSISTPEPTLPVNLTPTPTVGISALRTPEEVIAYLRQRGEFIAAVRADAPPFGKQNENGELEGFDIDVVRDFAWRWFGDPNAVNLVPVAAKDRITILREGKADLTAAALSYTLERCKQAACSQVFALDGARLLVRPDSGIAGICDLDGKSVSVLAGTTAERNIKEYAPDWCDYTLPPQIVEYETRAEAIKAVEDGEVAAYTTDGLILQQYENEILKVVGDEYKAEPYHIAVPWGAEGLLALINMTLQEMKSDGVYDQLHEKWFGCRNAPFPIFVDDSAPRPDFVKRTVILEPSRCGHTVPSTYQIQLGETLGGLALRFYGDLYLWPCIQAANNIADVRRIPAGQVLSIPPLEQCRG